LTARRQPRLKELAGELGLSIATVSRALAGYSDISVATRERVRAMAERVGYVPSRAGRSLVSGRTDFIGMLLQVRDHQMLDPALGEFVAGLGEGFAKRGRDLFIATVTAHQTDLQVLKHIVDGDRADALVLNRTMVDDDRIKYLLDRRYPFVAHGRAAGEARAYPWLDTDSEAAFADAARMLLGFGHRRFAMLTTSEPYNFAHIRRRGLTAALVQAGLTLPPEAVAAAPLSDPAEIRRQADHLLALSPRPTAILCATDALALVLLEQARARGIAVPEALSVIGFNNVPLAGYSDPPLSTYDQEAHRAAILVAEMLLDVLEKGPGAAKADANPPNLLLHPAFVARASHGPAPTA
jgi:LacI family transcriptional regulator